MTPAARLLSLIAALAGGPSQAAEPKPLDLASAGIAELNRAMDRGTLTSEQLVRQSLKRIEAYDRHGPALNAIITLNPKALEIAVARDTERRTSGRRSALHGIPVLVKDNIDTVDLPTTAGSFVLAGSRPPDDAEVIRRLEAAGAIILAKTNMSEFASGPPMSSVAGRIRNPYNPARSPGGSSGGTGVGLAAAFATVGLGTDTGGSIRVPASANGIVGLKPTFGLVSTDGVVPLAPSFDVVGPMARRVADVAELLGVIDAEDIDYSRSLDRNALQGARIGVVRDYMGRNAEIDAVTEAALVALRRAGAEVIEVKLPNWLRTLHIEWYGALMDEEFRASLPGYLATLAPAYPKTLDDLVTRAMGLASPNTEGYVPNPARWTPYAKPGSRAPVTGDPQFEAIRQLGLPLLRRVIDGVFAAERLDSLVYPTMQKPQDLVENIGDAMEGYRGPLFLANTTGLPELVLPIGVNSLGMPVSISMLGGARTEAKLLSLGYALEQDLQVYRLPPLTPALPGDDIDVGR